MCFIANAARQIDASEYTYPDGIIDPARIFQHFGDGGTIVFNQLHTVLPGLAELCRALEREISCRFQTNTYLTPAKSQGFPTHYDSHDVFVLQVHGVKHWLVYNTPSVPFRGQPFKRDETQKGEVTMSSTSIPATCSTCRAACDAQTSGRRSTSRSALTTSWTELLLEVVAKVALSDPTSAGRCRRATRHRLRRAGARASRCSRLSTTGPRRRSRSLRRRARLDPSRSPRRSARADHRMSDITPTIARAPARTSISLVQRTSRSWCPATAPRCAARARRRAAAHALGRPTSAWEICPVTSTTPARSCS
jgi:hypothetical protein